MMNYKFHKAEITFKETKKSYLKLITELMERSIILLLETKMH